jgi:hypothetical protein
MSVKIQKAQPNPPRDIVLQALVLATKMSTKSHVPTQAVLCRFAKGKRGDAKKELLKIAKKGLIIKHPTRGGITWQLTRKGLFFANHIITQEIDDVSH